MTSSAPTYGSPSALLQGLNPLGPSQQPGLQNIFASSAGALQSGLQSMSGLPSSSSSLQGSGLQGMSPSSGLVQPGSVAPGGIGSLPPGTVSGISLRPSSPSYSSPTALGSPTLSDIGAVTQNPETISEEAQLASEALSAAAASGSLGPGIDTKTGILRSPMASLPVLAAIPNSTSSPMPAFGSPPSIIYTPGPPPSPQRSSFISGSGSSILPPPPEPKDVTSSGLPIPASPVRTPSYNMPPSSSYPRALTPAPRTAYPLPMARPQTPPQIVSPLSTSYKTYGELLKDSSFDDKLLASGYVPLDVITLNGDGREKIVYIKAYNRYGDMVYINVDAPGGLMIELKNRTKVEVAQGSSIPKSAKFSAAECAGSAVCGVAFECQNGQGGEYCMINRDNSGQLYEGSYITVSSPSEKRITPVGEEVAYPIILLTEIDKPETLDRVRKATQAIYENAFNSGIKETTELKTAVALLQRRVEHLIIAFSKFNEFLAAEYAAELAKAQAFSMITPPLTYEQQEQYKITTSRLFELNKTKRHLLVMLSKFNRLKMQIQGDLVEANDLFYSLFVKTRRDFDTKLSKDIQDATAWGLPRQLNDLDYAKLVSGEWSLPDEVTVPGSIDPVQQTLAYQRLYNIQSLRRVLPTFSPVGVRSTV